MATSLAHIAELYGMYQEAKGENVTAKSPCARMINQNHFYYWVMLPSAIIIFALMFFVRRVNLWPNAIQGRFGVLIPMNFLDDKGYRLSYSAVFGLTSSLCLKMILQEYPVPVPGPSYLKVLVKIATMLLYGFALYPLLAALTMGTVLSLGLGTLYIWMFFIVNMIHLLDCVDDWPWQFFMESVFMQACPEILCSFFLSIVLPIRFVQKLIKKIRKQDKGETQEFFEDSYQAKYVMAIFKRKPKWVDDGAPKPKLKKRLVKKFKTMTYEKIKGFRYTPRIMATYTAGVILLYLVSIFLGGWLIRNVDSLLGPLTKLIKNEKKDLFEIYENHTWGKHPLDDITIIQHWVWTAKVCIIVALFICCVFGIVQIALGFRAYREDIINAWQGDTTKVGKRRNYPNLMVGFVRYSGYQVAYIFWAFALQLAFILILLLGVSYVIIIPMLYGRATWFLSFLERIWPVPVISLVVNLISKIAAKFLFLQQKGKLFAMDNRRLLFCVMYFLFFYNVFVGLFSCLLRMIKALLIGLFFLSRLDSSTLPKKFEGMDPGFKSYIGLIHVENAHTNPILMTFVNMVKSQIEDRREINAKEEEDLTESYHKLNENGVDNGELGGSIDKSLKDEAEKDAEKKIARRRKAVIGQWFLAYTLINNLPLRAMRKHYIDAEKDRIQRRYRKMAGTADPEEGEDGVELVDVKVTDADNTEEKRSEKEIAV